MFGRKSLSYYSSDHKGNMSRTRNGHMARIRKVHLPLERQCAQHDYITRRARCTSNVGLCPPLFTALSDQLSSRFKSAVSPAANNYTKGVLDRGISEQHR